MAKWGINIKMCHGTLTGSVIDFLSLSEGRLILIVMQIDGSYFILVNKFSFNKPDRMILLCYCLFLINSKGYLLPVAFSPQPSSHTQAV